MSRRPAVEVPGQLDVFEVLAAIEQESTEPEPATTAGPAGPTTVVDLHGRQGDPALSEVVYVGRPMFQGGWRLHGHPLANPFKVGRDGDARTVVDRYRAWVLRRPDLPEHLRALRGRRLGCWCGEGLPCHARVLAELADQTTDPEGEPK